jgi:5'-nucleotidase
MNILLTNDDGWDAPGLAVLQEIAKPWGDVWTMAPLHPMSGISHQMTFERPMALVEKAARTYALDGTPADCVRIAATQLGIHFDLVLSGINNGGNLGSDIYVSGTVAAAREASLRGIRAIALSQHRNRFKLPFDWTPTRWMAEHVLRNLLPPDQAWESHTLVNVNFPDKYHEPRQHSPNYEPSMSRPDANEGTPLSPAVSIINPPKITKTEFQNQIVLIDCPVDRQPVPSDFRLDSEGRYHYCSRYNDRARTPGSDIDTCFGGAISVSKVTLA